MAAKRKRVPYKLSEELARMEAVFLMEIAPIQKPRLLIETMKPKKSSQHLSL